MCVSYAHVSKVRFVERGLGLSGIFIPVGWGSGGSPGSSGPTCRCGVALLFHFQDVGKARFVYCMTMRINSKMLSADSEAAELDVVLDTRAWKVCVLLISNDTGFELVLEIDSAVVCCAEESFMVINSTRTIDLLWRPPTSRVRNSYGLATMPPIDSCLANPCLASRAARADAI